jgi:hypothetical protein
LTADAPKANASSGSRSAADAPKAANATRGEGQKSEKPMSTLSLQAQGHHQQDLSKLKLDTRKFVGGIGSDKAKTEAHAQITAPGERLDQVDRQQNSKKKIDLSLLEKKLGSNHIALIHALRDLDPESPHGKELVSIIESLDETSY